MGRLSKIEQVNHANFRFEPAGSFDESDRQVKVYNTRTSYDFMWALNHLCKIEGIGFFIIRKVIKPDSSKTLVLRGEEITLVGRFVQTEG